MNENIPMNEKETDIRSWLSENGKRYFDDMYYCRSLGAASNIKSIGLILLDLAENNTDPSALLSQINTVLSYYAEKRGSSSYAILRAVKMIGRKINNESANTSSPLSDIIKLSISSFNEDANQRLNKLKEYGWNVVKDLSSILLFDYSSTVNAMMEVASNHGHILDVYVTESRILDGGHQFIRNGVSLGHRMHYIPDAGLSRFIQKVDAAFIGAETIYPDGSVMNTLGSELTALLCSHYDVPLYVPTTFSKLNPSGFEGIKKKEHVEDGSAYFGLNLEEDLREKTSIDVVGLVNVPSKDITAFITEYGVIPPASIYIQAKKFMEEK